MILVENIMHNIISFHLFNFKFHDSKHKIFDFTSRYSFSDSRFESCDYNSKSCDFQFKPYDSSYLVLPHHAILKKYVVISNPVFLIAIPYLVILDSDLVT